MPATLSIDDAGGALLEIAAAGGEIFAYRVERLPPPVTDRATPVFTVQLTGGPSAGSYLVSLLPTGRWVCECKDHQFKGHRRPCKHAASLAAFRLFLLAWSNAHERQPA